MSSLTEELKSLEKQWVSEKQDAHIARRLLFIGWYVFIEPSFVTGINSLPAFLSDVWGAVLSVVERSAQKDLESALVLGYMISFSPCLFGPDETWLPKAQKLLENAYQIAEEQTRTKSELSQIGYQLAIAIERIKENVSSNIVEVDNEGDVDETFYVSEDSAPFSDMFFGETEYDLYFAHIFGCRRKC